MLLVGRLRAHSVKIDELAFFDQVFETIIGFAYFTTFKVTGNYFTATFVVSKADDVLRVDSPWCPSS